MRSQWGHIPKIAPAGRDAHRLARRTPCLRACAPRVPVVGPSFPGSVASVAPIKGSRENKRLEKSPFKFESHVDSVEEDGARLDAGAGPGERGV